jgi:outer membrane lipoprotein-sorting protein
VSEKKAALVTGGFVVLFLMLGFLLPGLGQAADDFEALRKSAQAIKTLSADFVQEKHLKILAKPIISKGRLYFEAPRSIRWEYLSPMKSLTLMNKGGARVFIWSDGKWVLDKAQSDVRGIVMDEINNWFTGRFDENPAFRHAYKPGPTPTVVLTPKEDVKNFISHIVLKISRVTGLVESVEIIENNDNRTKISFKNEKINAEIPDHIFEKP